MLRFGDVYTNGLHNGMFYKWGETEDITGEEDDAAIEMILYPNPSEGQVSVTWNASISGMVQVNIHDLSGRVVSSHELKVQDQTSIDLQLPITQGMYWIELKNQEQTWRLPVIKQ